MEPGDQIGDYRVESKIGEGGMSAVYRAVDASGRRVVVKELKQQYLSSPQLVDRFLRGATILTDLRHPHLARVYDVLEHQGRHIIVEEYLGGGSLAELLGNGTPVDPDKALAWCRDALRALNYVHEFGIVHRDIKPSNLMLDDEGRLRVIDFGIARVFGERRLTRTGDGAMGTPWYMSPEQIQTPNEVDHLTDVYSAGIVLYELLTGQVPFQGVSDFSIHEKITRQPPPPMATFKPGIDPAIERIVRKAIEKDAKQRHGGCGEFAAAIDRYISRTPELTWRERAGRALAGAGAALQSLQKRPVAVVAALAGVLALVALLNFGALAAVLNGRETAAITPAEAPSATPDVPPPARDDGPLPAGPLPAVVDAAIPGKETTAGPPAPTPSVLPPRAEPAPPPTTVPQPRRVHYVPPVYPPDARAASIEGTVRIELTVGANGRVTNVRVLGDRSSGPRALLDQAAVDAVRQWEYAPTLVNGTAIPVITTVSVQFVLTPAEREAAAVRPLPSPTTPVRAGGAMKAPEKIHHVAPVYPSIAQAARVQGTVTVEATIGTDGRVSTARVLRSIPLLDKAALDAVRQWVFTPSMLNETPVPVVLTVNVQFSLQ